MRKPNLTLTLTLIRAVALTSLLPAIALAAESAPDAGAAAAAADTPTSDPKPVGPDVSKMPFTRDSISRVISHHQPQIQACYEDTLKAKGKKTEGKLLTSFVITPEGLVKKAKVEKKGSTLHEPKLNQCVVSVLVAMTFPKPPDSKDHAIQYPFNLKEER